MARHYPHHLAWVASIAILFSAAGCDDTGGGVTDLVPCSPCPAELDGNWQVSGVAQEDGCGLQRFSAEVALSSTCGIGMLRGCQLASAADCSGTLGIIDSQTVGGCTTVTRELWSISDVSADSLSGTVAVSIERSDTCGDPGCPPDCFCESTFEIEGVKGGAGPACPATASLPGGS